MEKILPAQNGTGPEILQQMLHGFILFQVLYVTAKFKIVDLLKKHPMSAHQLATMLNVHESSLHRLLRVLISLNILAQQENGTLLPTALGSNLAADAPYALYETAIHFGEVDYSAWASLLHTIQTGEPAFDNVYKMPYFPYLEQHPLLAHNFQRIMAVNVHERMAALLESYNFSSYKNMIDIGGGQGKLLFAILQANPHLAGAIFEQPHVAATIQEHTSAPNILSRCKVVPGNFFESIPTTYDLYLLSAIIHDWDDTHALHILQNCRAAFSSEGTLLLCERIMPEQIDSDSFLPGTVIAGDLDMLALTGGYERTKSQFEKLLNDAGFAMTRVLPTSTCWSLIEAVSF